VRVWELATGRLLRTIRPPIDVGDEGEINAVAISPDGRTVAATGWTGWAWGGSNSIYLFDQESGRLLRRLTDLPDVIHHLAYSRNGAFLVATLGGTNGMRLYRTQDYTQVASDTAYGDASYGADFDAAERLVTTSLDGFVRLYDRGGKLRTRRKAPGGAHPFGVAFSPDGTLVAVGYANVPRVDVLSGADLALLYAPNISGVKDDDLFTVSWSVDSRWLYAGGRYWAQGTSPIRRWTEGGRGAFQDLPAAQSTIMHILPLAQDGVVFGAGAAFGVLDATGQRQLFREPAIASFGGNWYGFLFASDGATVQFSYEGWGKSPARFALRDRSLTPAPAMDKALTAPVITASGLNITDWHTTTPTLNGTALKLQSHEISHSLAIAPDSQHFLLGTDWYLRLFNRQGTEQWRVPVHEAARSVNIASNSRTLKV